jgi:membrane protease YdiL (CAAX protease family)
VSYTKIQNLIYRIVGNRGNRSVFHAVFFRLSGFVLFGLVSALIFKSCGAEFDFLSLPAYYLTEIILWSFFLSMFFIVVAYINASNSLPGHYPQFKIARWTLFYKILTYTTWILYLLGYEFMFRGILLFGIVEEMGYYPTIIFNVLFYAFVHIPKGRKEVLGCLLLGPVLCVLALKTGSIIIPVVVHIALCLANEYFSIRAEILNRKRILS